MLKMELTVELKRVKAKEKREKAKFLKERGQRRTQNRAQRECKREIPKE